MATLILALAAIAIADVVEPVQAPNERAAVTLQTVNEDNLQILLASQIAEFEKEAKRQKPLVLAFVTRAPGSLDFQREL